MLNLQVKMKIGYYIKKETLKGDVRIENLLGRLKAGGVDLYEILSSSSCREDTAMVLSFGGDGTFLSAAHRVCEAGLPILGINFGRMGFLAANSTEDIVDAVLNGRWDIEELDMLKIDCEGAGLEGFWPYALNEVGLHRDTAAMLGVDVKIGGKALPTYWADGLLVATSAGSTAYSLSAGGPICLPSAPVRIITPVAPHNLNLRPLVVPRDAEVELRGRSRHGSMILSLDNRSYRVPCGATVRTGAAPFPLRRVSLGKSNFIDALKSRFFWGQDVRNTAE